MSYSLNKIKDCFSKVGVNLKVVDKTFAKGQNVQDIFALDIRRDIRGNRRTEHFLMFPGSEDNQIHVAAYDVSLGQLVLTVKESPRQFWTELHRWGKKQPLTEAELRREFQVNSRARVKQENGRWWVENKVPSRTRHYLLGLDERQLFMAELRHGCSSIKQAHDSMKPDSVTLAEGKVKGKTYRQGEWFFVNPTDAELVLLKETLKSSTKVLFKKESIGKHAGRSEGNPHVADELLLVAPEKLEHGYSVRPRIDVYVRGAIRHVDHETIKFSSWRKVILNQESRKSSSVAFGSSWID